VYLLDEVHMLSTGAENALLKTLEEPPGHVVFVLATTEPHKVAATIRSRTQHLELTLLPADQLREHVAGSPTTPASTWTTPCVEYVLRVGGGSARDTLSALDQVVAAGGVVASTDVVDDLLEAVADRDPGRALAAVATALGRGREPRVIGELLLAGLRDVFLVAMGTDPAQLGEAEQARAGALARRLSPARLTAALEAIGAALVSMRQAPDPRVDLEVALVRLTRDAGDAAGLAVRIEELEQRLAALEAGGPAPSAQPAPLPPAAPRPAAASEPIPVPAVEGPPPAAVEPTPTPGIERSPVADAVSPPAEPRRPASTGRPRPADAARRALAERPAAPPPPRRAPEPAAAAPPAVPAAAAPAAAAPAAATPPAAAAPPAPAPGDDHPLGTADVEAVLGAALDDVRKGTRARFAAARLIGAGSGEVRFAVPNEPTRVGCEKHAGELAAALSGRLGTVVAVRVVVEGAPPRGDRPTSPPATDEPEEPVDPDELVDAPEADAGVVARLTSAFPGAELIEND
jgi:DNA polymerase III subunit gamma/tau